MLTILLSSQASLAQSATPAQSKPPADSLAMPSRMPEGHASEASVAENAEGPSTTPAQPAQVPPAQQLQAAPAVLPAQHASTAHEAPQQPQTLLGEVNNAVGAIATPTPAGSPHSWEDTGARYLHLSLETLIDVCEGGVTH